MSVFKIKYLGKCLLLEKSGERVLVIGDLHLGYEGAMRASGVMVPIKIYDKCIKDFDEIISFVGGFIDKIIILGDIKHGFGTILREEWNEIERFLIYLKEKCSELVVIEGNHDNVLFPILNKIKIVGADYYLWKNIIFAHGDRDFKEMYSKEIKFWILGHGHLAIALYDDIKKENYVEKSPLKLHTLVWSRLLEHPKIERQSNHTL